MGSMNKGSFKLNKISTRSKINNSSYNKNASKFGNNKIAFKEPAKVVNKVVEKTTEI